MQRARLTLLPVVILLLVSISACTSSQTEKKESTRNYSQELTRDDITNMKGTINEGRKSVLSFRSPHVYFYDVDTPYIEFVGGIKGTFYNKKTNDSSGYLEADYAIYTEYSKMMYLEKNVILVNQKGETLNAKELWWNQDKKTLYTDKAISFKQGNSLIQGTGLDAKEDMSVYTIHKISGIVESSSF